ncbi:hypothetical protein [Methanospirillum sp.]
MVNPRRCKHCKYNRGTHDGPCDFWYMPLRDTGLRFCSENFINRALRAGVLQEVNPFDLMRYKNYKKKEQILDPDGFYNLYRDEFNLNYSDNEEEE